MSETNCSGITFPLEGATSCPSCFLSHCAGKLHLVLLVFICLQGHHITGMLFVLMFGARRHGCYKTSWVTLVQSSPLMPLGKFPEVRLGSCCTTPGTARAQLDQALLSHHHSHTEVSYFVSISHLYLTLLLLLPTLRAFLPIHISKPEQKVKVVQTNRTNQPPYFTVL